MMINNVLGLKSNKEYIEKIVDVINCHYRPILKKSCKKQELVDYCELVTIRLTKADSENIKLIVDKVLERLDKTGYISIKGDRIKINKRIETVEEIMDLFTMQEIKPVEIESVITVKEKSDPINPPIKKNGPFVSISEYKSFDYKEFARRLKELKILPPSYAQTPASVKVELDKDNNPIIGLVYKSTTTPSYRTFIITEDNIHEYVNGAKVEKSNINGVLIAEWGNFRFNSLRSLEKSQRKEIKEIVERARKVLEIENYYYREQRFIRDYRKLKFKDFSYEDEIPDFVTTEEDFVLPFSPKTLEMCTLHLMGYAKEKEAKNIEYFKEKCRKVAEASPYKTEKWEKSIENLATYLTEYVKESEEQDEL